MDVDVKNKSVIDVGCWEGRLCSQAVKDGARSVLGIDMCVCDALVRNKKEFGFDFIQMDVTSDRVLEVPPADVVFSKGVLYHLPNPMNFIFKLRTLTKEQLVLGTAVYLDCDQSLPMMKFLPADSYDNNYSNWWLPNVECVNEMLYTAGFEIDNRVLRRDRYTVICSKKELKPEKILPRREKYMEINGGGRTL